jgi:uncharacterized repeat protein (TIGR01451 family)
MKGGVMRSKPMSRGSLSLVVITAVMAIFAIAGTGTAWADCSQPFNCFAGDDGNQASGPNGLTDWQDVASSVTVIKDPLKGSDNKFAGGDKETNPGGWDFITGNNTPKDDILDGWSMFDGRFLDIAFARVKQQGDTFLAFELNQDGAGPRTSGGIPVPHRSTGDILFTYDISTTNKVSFGMCTWQGDENSGNWLQLDGTPVGGPVKECTTLNKQTTPSAEGAVNWNSPIDPNYLTDFKPIGAGQFGEAVVDLGVLGGRFLSNPCGPNGWVWMHSRASRSVVSQPKDLLAGAPIASPTCSLTIDKKVSLSGAPGTFVDAPDAGNALAATVGDTVHYSMTLTNTGTAPLTVSLSDPVCDSGTITGGPNGDGSDGPLAGGSSTTYTCTHVLAATPDPLDNTACAHGTASMGSNTVTLGDDPAICDDSWVDVFQPGELASGTGSKFLDANANGAHDGDESGIPGFVFYVDYNDNSALDAGEPAATSTADGSWSISGIKPGTYNVREVANPSYTCTVPANGCSHNVTFTGGQTASIGEFGNAPVPQQQQAPAQAGGTPTTPPGQVVLGTRITPGRARLLGPTGCTTRAFRARIRGTKVAKVVFTLDGHRISTVTRKNYRGTFAVRIDPRQLRIGVHRLVAKVTFTRGSATKAKTFRLAFQRCPRALRAPRFTG